MSKWKEVKLGEVCDVTMGQSPSSETYNSHRNGLPFLQGNRTFGRKYPYFDTYCSMPKKVADEGDILISVRAPVGDLNISNCKICIGRGLASLKVKYIDRDFLYYKLYYLKNQIINTESGSVFGSINKQNITEIVMKVPNQEEQKTIASVLSSLDDKIDLLHRQNETLEKMAETLFRQWFVEEAGDDWEEVKLGDEFDFTMGSSPPGDSYNEDKIGMPMFQGNADFGFRFPQNRVFTTDPKRIAEQFDTLISVRAPVGAQNMATKKCCIGRGVAAFRYKKNKSYASYTYYKMKYLLDEIKQFNETGTVFGSISKSDFEMINITIPPSDLVEKFQKKISAIDGKIYNNTKQIQTLSNLRDTLLLKLMSGEVRIMI